MYDSDKSDNNDKVYNWFKNRIGKTFTKTEICKYYREFGFSRTEFANTFDNIIDNIKAVATLDGLVLNKERLAKNGSRYSLIEPNREDLSTDAAGLDEILASDN